MKSKGSDIILIGFFIISIFVLSILSLKTTGKEILNKLETTSIQTIQNDLQDIGEIYRNGFFRRKDFINAYGAVQLMLNKRMIGDKEFYKDNNGFMQAFYSNDDWSNFEDEVINLKKITDQKGVPLLYVQIPSRVIPGYTKLPAGFVNNKNIAMDKLLSGLSLADINVLDYRSYVNKDSVDSSNVFLKTDFHLTTEAELDVLKKLVHELESKYGLTFDNKDVIMDMQNYHLDTRKFLGNYAFSSGKYFAGLDYFNMYIPKFDTSFLLTDEYGNKIKDGSFQDVLMNGYQYTTQSQNESELIYWITNYMQYTRPCYRFENRMVDKNNILIAMDSMGFRTAAYLSLMCNGLTVVDPRFEGNKGYLIREINNNDYDVVILLQAKSLVDSPLVPKKLGAEIIYDDTLGIVKRNEKYTFRISVRNTGDRIWNAKDMIKLCIFQDGVDYGYRISLPEGVEVKPGEDYTFELNNFVAPPTNSTYLEYQMVEEGIDWFGEKKRVDIQVND